MAWNLCFRQNLEEQAEAMDLPTMEAME